MRGTSDDSVGVYWSPPNKSGEPVRVITSDTNALFSAGHLLWRSGTTLLSRPFNAGGLSGEERPVVDSVGSNKSGRIFASASASGVLAYAGPTPAAQLIWFDRSGKAEGPGEEVDATDMRLSPDGRRVATTRANGVFRDIWIAETGRPAASRLTTAQGRHSFPVWSPDGKWVAYSSGRGLVRREAAGGGAEQRLLSPAFEQSVSSDSALWPHDWSGDGRFLIFHALAKGTRRDLWLLEFTAEGTPLPPRLFASSPFDEHFARFAPGTNPKWVAYMSDETGRSEVYVRSFPEPNVKRQISTGGGAYPVWNRDGTAIYYVIGNKVMSVTLRMGTDSLEPSAAREALGGVALDSDGLGAPFAVSPDGRILARVARDPGPGAIEVVINWPGLRGAGQ